jgi:hypothetical protein
MIRNVNIWIPGYIRQTLRHRETSRKPIHLLFAIVDHFEPFWKKFSRDEARDRVREWKERLVGVVERFKDAEWRRSVHTFFCPEEE